MKTIKAAIRRIWLAILIAQRNKMKYETKMAKVGMPFDSNILI